MINKVLYLGPNGSYSELAKNSFSQYYSSNCEFEAVDSIAKVIKKLLEDGEKAGFGAVIPIENSIEGVVRETQDGLLALSKLGIRILAETSLEIKHALIGYGEKSCIKTILSHPQALAQCREYIYKNWRDDVVLSPLLSTSAAVNSLAKLEPQRAAIASEYCAKLYGIPVIDTCVNDEANNRTRFVLLSNRKPQKSDVNKVSIAFSTENTSGALTRVLNVFEKYGINMSYIDSRPSRKELGEYVFYVDFAGYIEDASVVQALLEIQPLVKMFEVLSEGANCV